MPTEEGQQSVSEPVQPEVAPVETTTAPQSQETEQTAPTETTEAPAEETQGEQATEEAPAEGLTPEEPELKPQSQNRFQKLANENRNLREQIRQLEQLKVKTADDFIEEGYDETAAEIQAVKEALAQRDAVDTVVNLNNAVNTDMERVLREYPQLDPSSKDFNKDLAVSIMQQYDRDAVAEYDPETGIMISTNQYPYDYIKSKMDLISAARAQAQVEAQRNVEHMVAHADTPSASAPSGPVGEETLEQMRERLGGVTF